MNQRRKILATAAASIAGMLVCSMSYAQANLPKGPITLVVPFASGGATDIVSRLVAKKVTDKTGVSIVVDNVAGGGGVVGAQKVARAAKDGTVLLMGTVSTHAINPLARNFSSYHPQKDFTPISLVATVPNVIVVNPSVPANNIKELIALAKAQPGKFNYGTSGVGTPPHLSGELFKSMAGVDMEHIPYKGGGPAMTDLIGGSIPVLFDVLTGAASHIKGGRAKALAVTTPQRSPSFPDVPTVAESGLKGYETYTWNAIFAPAGVPTAVAEALSKEFQRAALDPELQEKFKELSAIPVGSTPEGLSSHVKSELDKWGPIVKNLNLKLD
jgi:tripartite-type tricarboxylate transporter receptor subunit TctC